MLDQYSLDELRLVGIVTRVQPERALVIDPTGKGHIIIRGQFVGRAEIVQGGGSGADYEINWRVERIRDADIVLVRDDPNHCSTDRDGGVDALTSRLKPPGICSLSSGHVTLR